MRTGFEFQGVDLSDFGAVAVSERQVMPEVKERREELSFTDGSMDFTDSNPWGRDLYSDRIFKITIAFGGATRHDLIKTASKISAWLCSGAGALRFNDMQVMWYGRFINGGSSTPNIYGAAAKMELSFRCQPFSYLPWRTDEDIMDDCWLYEDLEIPDTGLLPLHTFTKSASGSTTFTFKNVGDAPVAPIITITATGTAKLTTVTLTYDDVVLKVSGIAKSAVIIDMETATVTDGDGSSIISAVTGEFFELAAGENDVTVYTNTLVSIVVGYLPRFFYDLEFRAISD